MDEFFTNVIIALMALAACAVIAVSAFAFVWHVIGGMM